MLSLKFQLDICVEQGIGYMNLQFRGKPRQKIKTWEFW